MVSPSAVADILGGTAPVPPVRTAFTAFLNSFSVSLEISPSPHPAVRKACIPLSPLLPINQDAPPAIAVPNTPPNAPPPATKAANSHPSIPSCWPSSIARI